jgi:phosphonoacetate hydrolase
MITVNGRDYRSPDRPVVAVCIDGSEPAYIEQAIAAGVWRNNQVWTLIWRPG